MLDPETAMDTVGKASEAAIKFQEIMLKVFGPRWTKKQADADAYADEKKLQTIRNNPDMEIVYTTDGMNARARTPEALAYRAEQRLLNDAIREQENLEKVFDVAADEIKQITDSSNVSVDDDWITRFTSIAKDIGSNEMRYIWGKILAGEIEKPGSFSMRTLETIRNISQKEAQVFQKIVPLVIQGNAGLMIASDNELNKRYGITYEDILCLKECALIISNSSLTLNIPVPKDGESHIRNESLIAFFKLTSKAQEETMKIDMYALTNVGRELYSILAHEPSEDYFHAVLEKVFNKNKSKITISTYRIINVDSESVFYDKTPLRIFEDIQGDAY